MREERGGHAFEDSAERQRRLNNAMLIGLLLLFHPIAVQYKEGRPRNLGRGVSKPKKNTVASLLAQSRAVGSGSGIGGSGMKPMLSAQQLQMLNPADMDYVSCF